MIRTIKPEAANIRTNAGKVIQSSPVIITNDGYDPPIQRLRTNAGKAIQVVSSQQVIEIVRPELMRVGGKPRGSGAIADAFDPTQVSGCQLWLDAQDTTTTLATEAGFVWRDKSTNNRHAYQNSLSLSPTIEPSAINGKRALRFNGSQYLIQPVIATSYTGLTIFAVFLISTANGVVLWGHRSEITRLIQLTTQTTTEVRFQLRSNANALQAISQTISASHQIATGILNVSGNNHNLYINNAAGTANITNFSGQNFDSTLETIGGTFSTIYSSFFDGWIGELIIYNRALNTNEIGAINAGLATKWG